MEINSYLSLWLIQEGTVMPLISLPLTKFETKYNTTILAGNHHERFTKVRRLSW